MEKAYGYWRTFQDQVLGRIAALLLVGCTLLAIVEIFRRWFGPLGRPSMVLEAAYTLGSIPE